MSIASVIGERRREGSNLVCGTHPDHQPLAAPNLDVRLCNLSPTLRRHSFRPRFPALLAHGDRGRVLALFFGRGITVRLLPRRYVDDRLGELVWGR